MRNFINIVDHHQFLCETSDGAWPQTIDGYSLANRLMDSVSHHSPEDWEEGDLYARITAFGRYDLRPIAVSDIDLGRFNTDDQLVGDYAEMPASSAPPVVYDPTEQELIDGNHRALAAQQRGDQYILGYVGDPATYTKPEYDEDY